MTKPTRRPANPCFSSGPCAKRPGWSAAALSGALLGRSHRSKPGVAKLAEVIERSHALLQMPADYRLGIVAGSDTGAVELALWSLLGARGGEAAHGMLALSPRAVERLESYTPPWPLPKLFRLTSNGKLIEGVFRGETINTPSMLCVEDALDSLRWAESVGGLDGLVARAEGNLTTLLGWVEKCPWADPLAEDPATISCTSPQFKITEPWFTRLPPDERFHTVRAMTRRLEQEGAAYDIASHRASPPGLRIWSGPTIERADIEALLPWLDWAWDEQRRTAKAA